MRVELHDAGAESSAALQERMVRLGFSRTITADGVQYELPPAESTTEGDAFAAPVRQAAGSRIAKGMAAIVGFVNQAIGWYGVGLSRGLTHGPTSSG